MRWLDRAEVDAFFGGRRGATSEDSGARAVKAPNC